MTSTSKELVRSSFSARAAEWMACYAGAEKMTLERMNLLSRQRVALDLLDAAVQPPAKVLDAGCGSGELAAKLAERQYDAHGIDIAEPMIHLASTRFGPERFQVADIESVPFPDNTFDAVVCLGVIEYLDSDDQALREIRRVLRPSGVAILATPNAGSLLRRIDRALETERRPAEASITHRTYSPQRWKRFLSANGFAFEEAVFHAWGWYRSPFAAVVRFLSHILRSPQSRFFAAEEIVRVRAVK